MAGPPHEAERDLLPAESRAGDAAQDPAAAPAWVHLLRRHRPQHVRHSDRAAAAYAQRVAAPGPRIRGTADPAYARAALRTFSSNRVSNGRARRSTKCCSPASTHASMSFSVRTLTFAVRSISRGSRPISRQ